MFTLLNEYNLFFLPLPNCNPWNFLEFKSQQLKSETIFDFDLLVILLSFMHYWCWNWHWCWYTCNFDCLIFVWNTIYVCRRFLPLITFTFLSNWVNLLFNLVHRGQLCSCSSGRKTQDTRKKIKIHVSWKRLSFIKETSLTIWSHFSLNPTKKLQSVWGEIFRQCHSSASYILRSPVWIEKDLEYFLIDHLIAMASLNWKESRIFGRGSLTRI